MQTAVTDCYIVIDFNDCIVGVELSVSLFVRLLNSLYIFNNVLSVNILNVNLCCIADKTEYG